MGYPEQGSQEAKSRRRKLCSLISCFLGKIRKK